MRKSWCHSAVGSSWSPIINSFWIQAYYTNVLSMSSASRMKRALVTMLLHLARIWSVSIAWLAWDLKPEALTYQNNLHSQLLSFVLIFFARRPDQRPAFEWGRHPAKSALRKNWCHSAVGSSWSPIINSFWIQAYYTNVLSMSPASRMKRALVTILLPLARIWSVSNAWLAWDLRPEALTYQNNSHSQLSSFMFILFTGRPGQRPACEWGRHPAKSTAPWWKLMRFVLGSPQPPLES